MTKGCWWRTFAEFFSPSLAMVIYVCIFERDAKQQTKQSKQFCKREFQIKSLIPTKDALYKK